MWNDSIVHIPSPVARCPVDSLSHIPEPDPRPVGQPDWVTLSLAFGEAVTVLRRQLAHPDPKVSGPAARELLRLASTLLRLRAPGGPAAVSPPSPGVAARANKSTN